MIEIFGAHTDAVVHDREHVAIVVAASVHLDVRIGRRERQRILDELGDDMTHVDSGRAVDFRFIEMTQAHALVALDFAERAAHNVADLHRRAPRARRFVSGQHEQRLGVASHPRCQVVEPEEMFECLRIGFVVLELRDEFQLAAEQVLIATSEIDERVGDVAAQLGLLNRQLDRAVLHSVERFRDLTNFTTGLDVDRFDNGPLHLFGKRRVEDLLHRSGQALTGHRRGLLGQLP